MMTTIPTNNDDVIDSRSVIEAIEELEQDARDAALNDAQEWDNLPVEARSAYLRESLSVDELESLIALQRLADEASGYSEDWEYGAALVRASYFVEYAQELAEDIGALPEGHNWPAYCIDWERAARELQMDYSMVDFGGVDYWVR